MLLIKKRCMWCFPHIASFYFDKNFLKYLLKLNIIKYKKSSSKQC